MGNYFFDRVMGKNKNTDWLTDWLIDCRAQLKRLYNDWKSVF